MSKKRAKAPLPSSATGSAWSLPLFFHQPYPIDKARHAHAAVRSDLHYAFARGTNSISLNAIECIEAVRHYPIVFTPGDGAVPVAIVGLESTNYFVQDGVWKADAYIPAYVRQYPFILMERPEEKKFYLCVDEASPHYSEQTVEGGLPLYQNGEPTETTNHALRFCTSFYQHHQATRHFVADLLSHQLLAPYQSEITLNSGRKISLRGFQMIDEKALAKLSDRTFLEFRRKGWLPFIYCILASTGNWKRLVDMAEPDVHAAEPRRERSAGL